MTGARARYAIGVGEVAGALGDLGVLVPLVAALVLVNGLDAGAVLLVAGLFVAASGVAFGIPFPVQPLKALTAVAVAGRLPAETIHAAGLEIGLLLLLLSISGVADALARVFTTPVVRALQFGVGALLVLAAVRLVAAPPQVFRGVPRAPWPFVLMAAAFGGVAWSAARRRYGLSLLLLAVGVAVTAATAGGAASWSPSLRLPALDLPSPAALSSAFLLLVVPQLPLTFGNAVVAVTDVSHRYLGPAARRVSPSRVCVSAGIGNVASALAGGMPMCHGAGGLTAHYRLGARSAGMNLLLGATFVGLGAFFGDQIPVVLGLLPVWVLAAFLAYAGLNHALLVRDLGGWRLALALTAGAVGAVTGNLALTAGLGIVAEHGFRRLGRRERGSRPVGPETGEEDEASIPATS